MHRQAWALKTAADGLKEAAKPATDARVSRMYSDALALMSGSAGESPVCVCGSDPCLCRGLRDTLQTALNEAIAKESQNWCAQCAVPDSADSGHRPVCACCWLEPLPLNCSLGPRVPDCSCGALACALAGRSCCP